MISYATAIGYTRSTVMTGALFVSITGLLAIPVFSAISDRLGRRTVILIGAIGIVAFACPMYQMVDSRSTSSLYLALVVGQLLQSAMYAPLGALLSEMFGTA